MKSFQEFLSEGPQGVGDYSTSGTEGGSYKSFQKRPGTGLGSAIKGAAKSAVQSVKNAGKNTAGSEQKRKPKPYRNEVGKKTEVTGMNNKPSTADKVKTAAKTAAKSRPMLGMAQRGDIKRKLAGTPQRKALSGGSSALAKRNDTRPTPPRRGSGIQPVNVRVIDDRKLPPSQKKLPPSQKRLPGS